MLTAQQTRPLTTAIYFRAMWLLCLLIVSFKVFPQQQSLRFALVAGNDAYAVSPLNNAVNDARDIAAALEGVGFEVMQIENADKASLHKAVIDFYALISEHADKQVLAAFYYAGHAVQINHRNYLVPLGFDESEDKFLDSLFDINVLLEQIPEQNSLSNIIVLDACRDNPLGDQLQTSGDGLAPVRAPSSTLIAYSTEPGNVAEDGEGDNGIYTHYLLKYIKKRIPTDELFRRVRKAVAKATGNRQIPWEHSSLLDEVYFHAPRNKDMPDLLSF